MSSSHSITMSSTQPLPSSMANPSASGVLATSRAPTSSASAASGANLAAIDVLANAIYGLQRQVHLIASRMPGTGGYDGYGPYAGAGPSPPNFLHDM